MIALHVRPNRFDAPSALGAVVMALGIFAAASLQRIPDGPRLTMPAALVLLLAWLGSAAKLLLSIRQGGLVVHTQPLLGSFGIGTWVAGTAMMARVAMLAWPASLWLAKAFFAASVALWLWFLPLAIRNLVRLSAGRLPANGIVLLATVATQAIAIMALRLFPGAAALHWTAILLIALGMVCYLTGLGLILRHYLARQDWRLAQDWHNTNCILHGALSITGLAAVLSGEIGATGMLVLWICAFAAFAIVETIEAARLVVRVRALGLRRALWVYDVSQWARNFTFGMFYAFTLAFSARFDATAGDLTFAAVRGVILAYGQYPVLFLLAAELALAATGARDGPHAHACR